MNLSRLLFWRRKRLTHLHVTMLTRRGCHLCDDAWEMLQKEQSRHGFTLQAVDVDKDPVLADRHGHEVPVVTINGQVRFRGGVNGVLLRRLLRAERFSDAS
jgi:glutaredoxin